MSSRASSASMRLGCSASTRWNSGSAAAGSPSSRPAACASRACFSSDSMPESAASRLRSCSATAAASARGTCNSLASASAACAAAKSPRAVDWRACSSAVRATCASPSRASLRSLSRACAASKYWRAPVPSGVVSRPEASAAWPLSSNCWMRVSGQNRFANGCRNAASRVSSNTTMSAPQRQVRRARHMGGALRGGAWSPRKRKCSQSAIGSIRPSWRGCSGLCSGITGPA